MRKLLLAALLLLPCFALAQNSSGPPGPNGYTIQGTEAFPFISGTAPVGSAQMNDIKNFVGTNFPTGANLSTGVVTPNGGSVARTLSAITADVINVKSYGAVGDDNTDDTAAINAAYQAARTLIANGSTNGVKIVWPYATYKVLGSINATSITTYPNILPIVIDGQGSTIDCKAAGKTCYDAHGIDSTAIRDLKIVGGNAGGGNPSFGLVVGRITTGETGTTLIENVFVLGSFTTGACYDLAVEESTWNGVHCYNSNNSANSYAAIFDAANQFNVPSDFVTVTAPTNTAIPLNDQLCLNCDFHNNAGGGPTLWIGGSTYRMTFRNTYVLNQGGGNPVVLDTTYGAMYNLVLDVHVEPGAGTIANEVLITGTNTTPTIHGITLNDQDSFATTQLFAADTGITAVTLEDLQIHVPVINSGAGVHAFDQASIYTVTGDVTLPASGNWNAPGSFGGQLRLGNGAKMVLPGGNLQGYQLAGSNVLTLPSATVASSLAVGNNSCGTAGSSTAANNVCTGQNSGASITSSAFNTLTGQAAGTGLTSGSGANALFGYHAGNAGSSTFSNTTCVGEQTCGTLTSGSNNTVIGAAQDVPAAATSNFVNINGFIRADSNKGILLLNGPSINAPTSCGGSPSLSTGATDTHGTVTEGTTATGCTIAWKNTHTNTPDCVLSSPNGAAFTGYTVSTTNMVITNASASGNKYTWHCVDPGTTP